jgi:NAD(P)-dependent dehydrogenase (short-subunit alcohol dehydrogenase family)
MVTVDAERFAGRTAIVTGASSGIGLAVARRLASEGCRLLLVASPLDEEDLALAKFAIGDLGGEVEVLAADLGDPRSGQRAVESAVDWFGGLDVLINCAGVAFFEEALETPIEHMQTTLAVNVTGLFAIIQAAAQVMSRAGRGSIVNTASTSALVADEFQVTYSTSKGAIVAMTRAFATDLANYGIRVNAVAPGWVETRTTRAVISDDQLWGKHRTRLLLDRPGSTDEIAALHAFLASDEAAYVSGAVFVCDGGMTAGFRWSDWLAAPVPEGTTVGIPQLSPTLGRPVLMPDK